MSLLNEFLTEVTHYRNEAGKNVAKVNRGAMSR